MGPQDQDDYINAVISIETKLSAIELLDALQSIENAAGRERKDNRWGARVLDCDILLYGNQVIDSERLTVPHYGMTQREFVLLPLVEIAPELSLPDGTPVCILAKNINDNGILKL
jgi:2-amino-4-hydroxy-6-hydroxymethyldihydropteridine diphosphokinase